VDLCPLVGRSSCCRAGKKRSVRCKSTTGKEYLSHVLLDQITVADNGRALGEFVWVTLHHGSNSISATIRGCFELKIASMVCTFMVQGVSEKEVPKRR